MDNGHDIEGAFQADHDLDVLTARSVAAALGSSQEVIPDGDYCYQITGFSFGADGSPILKTKVCPYWRSVSALPEQMNGYCGFCDRGDWEDGLSFLWDQVKACGVKDADIPDDGIVAVGPFQAGISA